MDKKQMEAIVSDLNSKASQAHDSNDALKFSQAALNAANSFCALTAANRA